MGIAANLSIFRFFAPYYHVLFSNRSQFCNVDYNPEIVVLGRSFFCKLLNRNPPVNRAIELY
ncbi:hypothetical protein CKA32_001005 [Geitlerinema sp. FC II]|nr:hypothetical protein CKA32_001005 [Geitlerinema sp. FC II]